MIAHTIPNQEQHGKNYLLPEHRGLFTSAIEIFKENIFMINYNYQSWGANIKYTYAVYGADSADTHYGQNIFISDFLASGEGGEFSYGNFNGQGILTHLYTLYAELNYDLKFAKAFIACAMREKSYQINQTYFVLGIKTDFINNMTHELKTPIATIGLACEALSDSNINLEKTNRKKFLATIKSENERLGKLVENVLQSSLSQKGNPELKLEIFNIEDVINKAIKSINLSFDKKGGIIKTDFLAQNKLMEADKLHIANVIYNLLDNSQKYSSKSPVVTISTRDIIGGVDKEVERHGTDSFCCGAGGAQMWMEEDADKRVNQIRAKEIAETGCDTVAVGCPFCSIMVKDGLDSVGAEMDVKDVAEILWEQIVARDEEIQAAAGTNAPE